MKKLLIILCAPLVLAGCASFSIRNESRADAREGREYRLEAHAFDKKAQDITVTFVYRINGGRWFDRRGVFNGRNYEALIPAGELPKGNLEYYAWFTNAKGERVTSRPVIIAILTFEEARQKAVVTYRSSLSNETAQSEIYFNTPAEYLLRVKGTRPASVTAKTGTTRTSDTLPEAVAGGTLYRTTIATPHTDTRYSLQWTVTWEDSEFGTVTLDWPEVPVSLSVVDREAARARVRADYRESVTVKTPVSGSWLEPPVIGVKVAYTAILSHFSQKRKEVRIQLRQGDFSKTIVANETKNGEYTAVIPADDMEKGVNGFTVTLLDRFDEFGGLENTWPSSGMYSIAYTNRDTLKKEAVAKLAGSWKHTAPTTVISGEELSILLDKNTSHTVLAARMEFRSAKQSAPVTVSGRDTGTAWLFTLPPSVTAANWIQYRFVLDVSLDRLGSAELVVRDGTPGSENDFIVTPKPKATE